MMRSTQQKIALFLINTKDHELNYRDLAKRIKYRKDFQPVYDMMLRAHVIEERGSGTKYDPKIVHLIDPTTGLNG
jgi:hypothetical protein